MQRLLLQSAFGCLLLLVSSLSISGQTVTANPDTSEQHALMIWLAIKGALLAPKGLEYWQQNIKYSLIPGGAEGVERLTGFVIASAPTEHPSTLVFGIINKKTPEVELRFVDRRRHRVFATRPFPVGSKVQFQGVGIDYATAPFRVAFEADLNWVVLSKSQ